VGALIQKGQNAKEKIRNIVRLGDKIKTDLDNRMCLKEREGSLTLQAADGRRNTNYY